MKVDKVRALITGGSRGIGYATAKMLIDGGAKVAIAARNEERVKRVADELGAIPIIADVADEASCVAMVKQAAEQLDGYNTLVNNAGFGTWARLEDTKVEDLMRVMATNVAGAMVAARESLPHFKSNGSGNIVNISSTAGKRGFPGGSYYTASKFALGAMNECWRAELREHNIRVMLVHPSEVQTSFFDGEDPKDFNPSKLHAEDIAHGIVSMLSMENRGFITDLTVWATNPQ